MKEPFISDEEKTRQGHEAFKAFVDALGPNDIYKQILLEEFFKLILSGNYDFSILGRDEQEGHEAGNDVPGRQPTQNKGGKPGCP